MLSQCVPDVRLRFNPADRVKLPSEHKLTGGTPVWSLIPARL
jgi:hypothetical protein